MAMRTRIRRRSRRSRGAPRVRRCACQGAQTARADAKGKMEGSGGVMIGGAHDPAERAADRMAAQALSGGPVSASGAGGGGVRRECAKCAEEREAKRDASPGATVASGAGSARASASASNAINGLGAGRPLARSERAFFEPRFGRDFSNVRVHEDSAADKAANAIDARAFAYGDDIAFAKGERSKGGDRLMAHELAHVAQDDSGIRRSVRSTPQCKDNVEGAPADVAAAAKTMDAQAQTMAHNAALALNFSGLSAMTFEDFSKTDPTTLAFYRWFGAPQKAPAGGFASRFGGVFDTEIKAAGKDMQGIAQRFRHAASFLSGPIDYVCAGDRKVRIGSCAAQVCFEDAGGKSVAFTCTDGARRIAICPAFWSRLPEAKSRGSMIVHEALHTAARFDDHQTDNAGRPTNPACYGSFLRDVTGAARRVSQCSATGETPRGAMRILE